jgi:hypothetical protein
MPDPRLLMKVRRNDTSLDPVFGPPECLTFHD